jgi:predicted transcriptional regulator
MRARRRKEVKTRKGSQDKISDVRRRVEAAPEMNLRALRESVGKTQGEMARLADVSQSQLSKMERRENHLISTVRKYVKALGGDLEVVAVVGDKRIALRGV